MINTINEESNMSMNKLEGRQQLLVITMEECGELIQACSKALRKQDLFEQQNLKDEIGDVYAMINLLVEHDVVSWTDLEDRVDYKKNKLKKKTCAAWTNASDIWQSHLPQHGSRS